MRIAPKTTELLLQRGEYVPGQGVPLFELRPPVLAGTDWVVKKAFDLVVSSVVVLVGLPLWLLIALAIKLDSRGPVLYRDRRIGVGEREFGMLKFRTMVQGAAEQQAELEDRNEAGGALFKIRDDPRVTRVGRVLRRLSIDELPQVLNVLRGEMSLVGPRPLPLRDYRQLEAWHRKRYHVLPGITGLWQISGRSNLTFDDLVRLDFYYIENWSIWLDISILVKTLPAVLVGRGAALPTAPSSPLRMLSGVKAPKILAVASAVDLDFRYGCTPAWWQLWKGLYEVGVDLIVTPYRGRPVESPWWRTAPNPTWVEGESFAAVRGGLARLKGDRYLRRAEESPDESGLRQGDARGDLALGDAALAAAPDEGARAREGRRRGRSSSPSRWRTSAASRPTCASASASR